MSRRETAEEVLEGLRLGESGKPVLELQKLLNLAAQQFGKARIEEDGYFGPDTRSRYRDVVWLLGVQDEPLPPEVTTVSPEAVAAIRKPAQRTGAQIERALPRGWNLGPEVTSTHVMLGTQLLALIGDWDSWVNRRVDAYKMADEDDKVFVHRKSIDFRLPAFVGGGCRLAETLQLGGFPTPVSFDEKWRLHRFDVRDESGCSVSLLSREQQAPIAAGVLISYAHYVHEGRVPPFNEKVIPQEIERDLRAIVNEERDTAVAICAGIGEQRGSRAGGPPVAAHEVAEWREALATSPHFMELAYEMARRFLVLVACPAPSSDRRVLKISRELPSTKRLSRDQLGQEPVTFKRRSRGSQALEDLRAALGADGGSFPGGKTRPAEVGELRLSCVCTTRTVGSRWSGTDPPCVRATLKLKGSPEVHARVALGVNSMQAVRNLPVGVYEIQFEPLPGVCLLSSRADEVKVGVDDPGHTTVRCAQVKKTDRRPSVAGSLLRNPKWRRRLQQGIGWRSKLVLVQLRFGEGGSYHFEFEAPPGIQVTRAKLIDDRRGLQDLVTRSLQRTHLYVPRDKCEPATAYALLNVRPRAETVVRTATLTALFAFVVLAGIAGAWWLGDRAEPGAIAFLLAVPGGLSAYLAQNVSSRVTAEWLYGLRLTAIAPGILCFMGAALVVIASGDCWGKILFSVVAGLAGLVLLVFVLTWRWAAKPPEQGRTQRAQGPGYAEPHLRLLDTVGYRGTG